MIEKKQRFVYLAAAAYACIIGCSLLFVKLALESAHPIDILAHRFTLAMVVVSIPVLLGWVRLNIKLKELFLILPLVVLYPLLYFILQTFGMVTTPSSEAGIYQATVPIFTMIMAVYWLKESLSLRQKLSALISVGGVVYIFAMKGVHWEDTSIQGTLLIVASAICLAGYGVLGRKLLKNTRVATVTYMMTMIGFIGFNSMAIWRNAVVGTLGHYFEPFMSPWFIVSIMYLGIMASVVSSFLSNYVLSKIEASRMSVFNNLSTLVTVAAGIIFLQEKLMAEHVVGGAAIIAGVIGANWPKSKLKPEPKPKLKSAMKPKAEV
jgi:drug/metabolite transporter (DMT)-like permease